MRLVVVALSAAVLVLPASASVVDPRALVLRNSDVPARFTVDPRESEVTSNESYSRYGLSRLVARSGRIAGYRRVFRVGRSRVEVIQSQVDLFGGPDGARSFLAWVDAEQRRHNARRGVIQAFGREGAEIGEESWVYWSGYPGYYVLVAWRHDRVLGVISSWDVGRQGTLKLARIQQRRMAAALR